MFRKTIEILYYLSVAALVAALAAAIFPAEAPPTYGPNCSELKKPIVYL